MKKITFLIIILLLIIFFYQLLFRLLFGTEINDKALIKQAINQNNPILCDKVKGESRFDIGGPGNRYTKNYCYDQVAISSKNPLYCETGGSGDNCFSEVAKASRDVIICNKINNQVIKGECYGKFTSQNNSDICQSLKSKPGDIYFINSEKDIAMDSCYGIYLLNIGDVDINFCKRNFNTITRFKSDCFNTVAKNKF